MSIDLAPTILEIARASIPPKMQGRPFLGDHVGAAREYVFSARDRCDETPFRFRTVRDGRYRYIRNFTPEKPFLQANEYKERSYPVWNLLKELHASGKLSPDQEQSSVPPTMPEEELYDLERDPHEVENLAAQPEHRTTRDRLRKVLDDWIVESDDQGRFPESEELIRRQGVTRPNTPPNTGYALPVTP